VFRGGGDVVGINVEIDECFQAGGGDVFAIYIENMGPYISLLCK